MMILFMKSEEDGSGRKALNGTKIVLIGNEKEVIG
jgi:hypothetical protein